MRPRRVDGLIGWHHKAGSSIFCLPHNTNCKESLADLSNLIAAVSMNSQKSIPIGLSRIFANSATTKSELTNHHL